MLNDVFKEVLTHDGVVSMTTWSADDVHVSNTWNSYLEISGEDKILIPAAWLFTTEKNIKANNQIIVTLGSPQVQGKVGMGTGFVIKGTAHFIAQGPVFDAMKEKYSFASRVLEVTVASCRQTI